MLTIFLYCLLVHGSRSYVLTSNHHRIYPRLTKNVVLKCAIDDQCRDYDINKFRYVDEISIYKSKIGSRAFVKSGIGYKVASGSELVAKVEKGVSLSTKGQSSEIIDLGAIRRGNANNILDSFLTVTWHITSMDTEGQYVCLILSHFYESYEYELTEPLQIRGDLLLGMKPEWSEWVLQQMAKREVGGGVRLDWPTGHYAILRTRNGCPIDYYYYPRPTFSFGTIRINMENTRSLPENKELSDLMPRHLYQFRNGRMYGVANIWTCVRNFPEKWHGTAFWPRGRYCIHRYLKSCPRGFKEGGVQLDTEDDELMKDYRSQVTADTGGNLNKIVVIFCCRDDGLPGAFMTLPNHEPFFLYRYKGECQMIAFMYVKEFTFLIRTELIRNIDGYTSSVHPDSSLNPVIFHLCYYYF